jgi:uncharacterized protein (DUF427 family)
MSTMKIQAVWNGQVLAESDHTVIVEGNHYFPPEKINRQFFEGSSRHTICPWKGVASYYDIVVGGKCNPGAAWYYPDASPAAKNIEGYVAFWQGVKVEAVQDSEAEIDIEKR